MHPPRYKVPAPRLDSADATVNIPSLNLSHTLLDAKQSKHHADPEAPSDVSNLSDTLLRPYGNEDVQMEPLSKRAASQFGTTNPMIEEGSEVSDGDSAL